MDLKKLDFIKKHFGCYTLINKERVLTSIGTMSIVPSNEFWNIFSGDAEKYFMINVSETKGDLVITLKDGISIEIERVLNLNKKDKI